MRTGGLLVLGLLLGGCNREQARRTAALEAQVKVLTERLEEIEDRPSTAVVEAAPTYEEAEPDDGPEPDVLEPLVERVETARDEVEYTRSRLAEVDDDLAALEEDFDSEMERVDALARAVERLATAVEEQAATLDALALDVERLRKEHEPLKQLGKLVSVEDGNVVIDKADLVLRQGVRSDGMPDGRGRIYTLVEPRGE